MDELRQFEQLRGRRELEFLPVEDSAVEKWCVFDPISRQSFRAGYVEKWLLCNAIRPQTALQLVASFRKAHPSCTETDASLLSTVSQLTAAGLLRRQTEQTHKPQATNASSWITKLVMLQIRGVHPEPVLRHMAPYCWPLFSARAVLFWLGLAVVATIAVLLNFDRLSSEIGAFNWLVRPSTGGTLFLVFLVTRGLHELGHALVCTRFGIRCPDIGIFAILGAPCVYCDVSESWKLSRRWKRAAVASAGMYVELIVATLAAFTWLASRDGSVHSLAMQTMLVCSVGTMLININPLMRFDGYYILADWLDETNLRSKADGIARDFLKQWLLGAPRTTTSLSRAKRCFLITFSVAGMLYRSLLSITIAGVVVAMFHQWYLPWIGRALAVAILLAWWSPPTMKLVNLFGSLGGLVRLRFTSLFAMVVLLLLAIPLPSWRFAEGWVEPWHALGVYADENGLLVEGFATDGEIVAAGQSLFRLANSEIAIENIKLESELRSVKDRNMHLSHNTELTPSRVGGPSGRENNLRDTKPIEARLHKAAERARSLEIVAPSTGRLVAMRATPPRGAMSRGSPAFRPHSHWCEAEQIGRTIHKGTQLAAICSSGRRAVIELDRTQLDDVIVGTPVRLRFPHLDYAIVEAEVAAIVNLDRLSSIWQPETMPSASSIAAVDAGEPAQFAAVVELPESFDYLPGTSVEAVFLGQPKRVYSIIARWIRQNLNLLAD